MRPFLSLKNTLLYLLLGLSLVTCQKNTATGTTGTTTPSTPVFTTFINPLLASAPDPWVYQKDGFYYFLSTSGGDVRIRKTAKMS